LLDRQRSYPFAAAVFRAANFVPPTPKTFAAEQLPFPQRHVPALDGLRGTAILLVLLFHFPAPTSFLVPVTRYGWCGVDLFFVLSGYLITSILYTTRNKTRYFRNFYIRRSLRIFPLYYGFLIIALFVLPRLADPHLLGVEPLSGGVWALLLYYSDFAAAFIGWPPQSVGAFWSLSVEEHFYFFWPLLIKRVSKGRLLFWAGMIALLSLMIRLAIAAFKFTWLAAYYVTPSRLDGLAVGAMLAILMEQHPERLKLWMPRIGSAAAAVLAAIAIWRHGFLFDDWPMRTFGYSLLAVFFATAVWKAATTQGRLSRFLSNPVLVKFGTYSYCIYVCHLFVLSVCQRWLAPQFFHKFGLHPDAPLPLFLVALGGTWIIAELSWRFYESPLLALKNRFGGAR
jgi:peptidoglycan/LPS O-acetylase OafA/YrhL